MKRNSSDSEQGPSSSAVQRSEIPHQQLATTRDDGMAHEKTQKRLGKRPGRKPSKIDQRAKLERSRQSARECRARKKLRYQYLEELVASREKAVYCLREELDLYRRWCINVDSGCVPDDLGEKISRDDLDSSPPRSPKPDLT